MGHRLLRQGLSVVAWDRDPDHIRQLAERGAVRACSPEEVLTGARAVITMLPTADIVLEVVGSNDGGLPQVA